VQILLLPYYSTSAWILRTLIVSLSPGLSDEILSFEPVEVKANTRVDVTEFENGEGEDGSAMEKEKNPCEPITKSSENEMEEEVELDNLLFEESSTDNPDVWKQEKSEKVSNDGYGHMLGNIDDIWKKAIFSYLFLVAIFVIIYHCNLLYINIL
jgi:hypothetical protein